MESLLKKLSISFLFISLPALSAGKITAEKNCTLKIVDSDFAVGNTVYAMRSKDGKSQRVATVKIMRLGKGFVVGKVLSGVGNCKVLKGLSVEAATTEPSASSVSSSGGAKTSLPKFDAYVGGGVNIITLTNVHLDYVTYGEVSLMLNPIEVQLDVYPLQFAGNGLWHRMFGLGIKYQHGLPFSEIPVDNKNKTTGKTKTGQQLTTPTFLHAEGIVRVGYLKDTMSSEGRVGYLIHNFTNEMVSGDLKTSPLRNISWNFLSLGVKQRVQIGDSFRITAGGNYLMGLAGTTPSLKDSDNAVLNDSTELANPSGYEAELALDFFYKSFKLTGLGGIRSFAGDLTLKTPAKTISVGEKFMYFQMGLGFIY